MSRLLFLSITSLVVSLGATAGCGGEDCGPGGAAKTGLVAGSVDAMLTYGNLVARAGNDCPATDTNTVVSLTIEGTQTDGAGLITFCIPRPDKLDATSHTIGNTQSMADVRIIDLGGSFNNCTFALDSTRPPTGEAKGTGVCGDGVSPEGFALNIDGAMSLRRTCGATVDSVAVTLTGTVAVAAE